MLRYGIYGGAFDPVHLGHLLLAENCLRQANLDRIFFVPTGISPHRNSKEAYHTSTEDRYNMLEAALLGYDEFLISRFEIDRQEKSYTVDTLRYFHRIFALTEPKLFLLMGADMFNDLPNWYEVREICRLAVPLVAERSDTPLPYFAALSGIAAAEHLDEIGQSAIQMPQIGISSTQIRQRIQNGESIRFQVPAGVEAYITAHHLYQ
ncbi:MAG: nicotinate-nucleotide adenylyltransferase [Planctomycetaceae bacterium]|jgi:nicotinate-nucleotide adenylyltransferase|nr:nicotinate-nucleotide adenylyltransferase [Planctomycetaceae bacterium]